MFTRSPSLRCNAIDKMEDVLLVVADGAIEMAVFLMKWMVILLGRPMAHLRCYMPVMGWLMADIFRLVVALR